MDYAEGEDEEFEPPRGHDLVPLQPLAASQTGLRDLELQKVCLDLGGQEVEGEEKADGTCGGVTRRVEGLTEILINSTRRSCGSEEVL